MLMLLTALFELKNPYPQICPYDNSEDYYIDLARDHLAAWRESVEAKVIGKSSASRMLLNDDFLGSAIFAEIFNFLITRDLHRSLVSRFSKMKDRKVSDENTIDRIEKYLKSVGIDESSVDDILYRTESLKELVNSILIHSSENSVSIIWNGKARGFSKKTATWARTSEAWTLYRIKSLLTECSGTSFGVPGLLLSLCRSLNISEKISMEKDVDEVFKKDRFDIKFCQQQFVSDYKEILHLGKVPVIEVMHSTLTDLSHFVDEVVQSVSLNEDDDEGVLTRHICKYKIARFLKSERTRDGELSYCFLPTAGMLNLSSYFDLTVTDK